MLFVKSRFLTVTPRHLRAPAAYKEQLRVWAQTLVSIYLLIFGATAQISTCWTVTAFARFLSLPVRSRHLPEARRRPAQPTARCYPPGSGIPKVYGEMEPVCSLPIRTIT